MSDLTPHSRDDLVQLPCDVEPTDAHECRRVSYDEHLRAECPVCGHGKIMSPALCSRLNPPRSLLRAQLEVSAQRLPPRPSAELISLAQFRAGRR